ncbi:MAG: hypothetical protein JRH20_26525 [Deltaproteobacteria bacterium]|nr:hypothetical protein [Deltaproteobacteria bacterium]
MSIIQTLKKVVDPNRAREEEASRKSLREQAQQAGIGEGPSTDDAPSVYLCRICEHVGPEERFCRHCLAETMVPMVPAG